MTQIEHRVEGTNVVVPDYSNRTFSEAAVAKGLHRQYVVGRGGSWDEGGAIQLEFLRNMGMKPTDRVIDIGCGALRAGRHLVGYLEPGHYYGVDANPSIIQLGYDKELDDEQRALLPIENLRANDRFDTDFGVKFDMAIAQSVFTHVSLNHIRLCLYRLAKVMEPGKVFYASYCPQPKDRPLDHIYQRAKNGRTYFYEKNVFWYRREDLRWATRGLPWEFSFVGDYGSPQGQKMGAFTRVDDTPKPNQLTPRQAHRRAVDEEIAAGGAKSYLLRARRKAARAISPY